MGALYRRSTITLAISALIPMPAAIAGQSDEDVRAPFGLTWGLSADEIRKLGVRLSASTGQSTYGVSFTATDLSKVITDTESVALFFGYRDKLWRIAAIGRSIGPDPSGGQIVARYQDLAAVLSERYGRGVETDIRDHEMWKGPNEYVMSLKVGRAFRYTNFHTPNVDVELSVRAVTNDTAYYLILFEYRPGAREFEADKKIHEKDAL